MSDNVNDLQLLEPTELLEADLLHDLACCCDTVTSLGTEGSGTIN
jgi:hypothetical protein